MHPPPAVGSLSAASLSADELPRSLARLIGQHPAALRAVCWAEDAHEPGTPAHLEIETKHGFVTLIDHQSGTTYANPPAPPDLDVSCPRWQQDLTEAIPGAFSGRPVFATITPMNDDGVQTGWRFEFDTGAAFTFNHSPSTTPFEHSLEQGRAVFDSIPPR